MEITKRSQRTVLRIRLKEKGENRKDEPERNPLWGVFPDGNLEQTQINKQRQRKQMSHYTNIKEF